jgi:hypothetical protein
MQYGCLRFRQAQRLMIAVCYPDLCLPVNLNGPFEIPETRCACWCRFRCADNQEPACLGLSGRATSLTRREMGFARLGPVGQWAAYKDLQIAHFPPER